MIAIVNASPLIYLAKIGVIGLLPKLFSQIYTTLKVKEEVLRKENTPEWLILNETFSDWITIENPENQSLIKMLEEMRIHSGEASVIALGKELTDKSENTVIVIDDLVAREIARTLNLKVVGTIGILLRYLRMKIITKRECKKLFQLLIETTTFRITASLYARILEEINEFHSNT